MSKILLIGWKDLTLAFRDRAALMMILLGPFLLIVGMAFVSGRFSGSAGGIAGIPVVLVNQDGGQLGNALVALFGSTDLAELVVPTELTAPEAARARVDSDQAAAAVIIPAGFSANITSAAGGAPTVQIELYLNPTSPTSAGVIQGIVEQFLGQVEVGRITGEVAVAQLVQSGRIAPQDAAGVAAASVGGSIAARQAEAADASARATVKTTTAAGEAVRFDPLALMAPSMALMFLMFAAALGGRSLLIERNQGTLPRLLISPVRPWQVLAGKTIGTFLTCLAQVSILIAASALLFGLRWGDWLGVVALVVAASAAATGWGIFIAGLARSPGQVSSIGSAITLLFGILGGAFIDQSAMPAWFRAAGKISPNAWGLDGFTTLALGGRLADVLLPVAALLVMAVVVFGLALAALRLGRKELALL